MGVKEGRVVALLNEKGGVSKTTLTLNLAHVLQELHRKDVLMVDSDPQGSLREWYALTTEADGYPTMMASDTVALVREIPRHARDHDLTLVDGCPKSLQMIAATVAVADVVLILVQPSPFDLWAAMNVLDLVKQRQEVRPDKPRCAFVITRQIQNTIAAKDALAALEETGVPIFDTANTQRVAYPMAAAEGKTVERYDPNCDAAFEIRKLARELVEFCK